MTKIIVAFCEGDHDIAFLERILRTNAFLSYEQRVIDFIYPLNELYLKKLEKKKIKDIEFKYQQPNKNVPYTALTKDDTLVVFHNLTGDGNIINGNTEKIKNMYLGLIDGEDDFSPSFDFRFLYFLDADDLGVNVRLEELRNLLSLENLEENQIINKDNYEIGCSIFHDKDSTGKKGKLEDILLLLMKKNNEEIFNNSQDYIDKNMFDNPDRQRKFMCTDSEERYISSSQFKKEKSIISIAGQLQFSGSTNAVIIANSDFIQREDIINNDTCQNIIDLFN